MWVHASLNEHSAKRVDAELQPPRPALRCRSVTRQLSNSSARERSLPVWVAGEVSWSKMCRGNCVFVIASLLLTLTFLAVGVSFFGPYWISNLHAAKNETAYADPPTESYLPGNMPVYAQPDRGLWAQCGQTCTWFWNDDSRLQTHLLIPLSECHTNFNLHVKSSKK